jgi:hypothetical protein
MRGKRTNSTARGFRETEAFPILVKIAESTIEQTSHLTLDSISASPILRERHPAKLYCLPNCVIDLLRAHE